MTATLDPRPASPGSRAPGEVGRQHGGTPPRRAGGAVLVVLGLVVAGLVAVTTALTVVGVLVRQQSTTRETLTGIDAAALDLGCAGDVSVVADGALAPGTAEVTWSEHWSTSRPRHGAAVVGATLELSSSCPGVSFGGVTASDVTLRVPEGTTVTVDAEVGDVTTRGAVGDVAVAAGYADVDVRGADADVSVRAEAGDVELIGVRGSADVDLGTGDVRVVAVSAPTRVRVKVGVGDADVSVPADGRYDVSASTGLGDAAITVDDEPGATGRVAVSVGVGDVTVRPLG